MYLFTNQIPLDLSCPWGESNRTNAQGNRSWFRLEVGGERLPTLHVLAVDLLGYGSEPPISYGNRLRQSSNHICGKVTTPRRARCALEKNMVPPTFPGQSLCYQMLGKMWLRASSSSEINIFPLELMST